MERYELGNGRTYEIIRWPDGCTVVKDGRLFIPAHTPDAEDT